MTINITKQQIDIALSLIEDDLKKYYWIQNNLNNIDVSRDRIFQKKYNGFYKVRRNHFWRQHYFSILERAKFRGITFEKAMDEILRQTGRYEASFASKLVATVNPEFPVIDKYVLKNVGLRLPYYSANDKKARIIEVYEILVNKFQKFMQTEIYVFLVKRFAEKFPWANINPIKMVDLVLWKSRSLNHPEAP